MAGGSTSATSLGLELLMQMLWSAGPETGPLCPSRRSTPLSPWELWVGVCKFSVTVYTHSYCFFFFFLTKREVICVLSEGLSWFTQFTAHNK